MMAGRCRGALPLARPADPCEDARPMFQPRAHAPILTSARMAAGMTSRARRRLPNHQAG